MVEEVLESTPAKSGGMESHPDFAESPVVTMETEEIQISTEEPASSKKKSKRRTPKKRTQQQNEDEGDHQVF